MNGTARPSFATWRAGGYAHVAHPRHADPSSLQTLAGRTMGTTWSLKFDNPDMLPHDAVRSAVDAALDRVIAQMSTWAPTSDICRYNRAPAGSRHILPPEFAQVLDCALHWAAASEGAIDPTIGPLVALWGFGADARETPSEATPEARAAARACVGWQRLEFDRSTRALLQPGGIGLDFSGVAKGFAVDHAVEQLQALGLRQLLMEVGGELRGVGRRPGGLPWQVQVDAASDLAQPVALTGMAIATSGDRWHTRTDGRRSWSHTIDPRSGEPAASTLSSVSVLHTNCMHADALATALTVLGAADGMRLAETHGIAALFVRREAGRSTVLASDAWSARNHRASESASRT